MFTIGGNIWSGLNSVFGRSLFGGKAVILSVITATIKVANINN